MKRLFLKITLVVCLMLVIMVITGSDCDKSTDSTAAGLVDTWVLTSITEDSITLTAEDADHYITIVFADDGTYSFTQTIEGDYDAGTGTWSATSTMLTMTIASVTVTFPYTLSGDTLTITNTDEGIVFTFMRS